MALALPSSDQAAQKYEEAAAAAVEACAEDTEGQTCYICMDDGSKEGLVRACACRGTAGFGHVSCLVRQAQVAVQQGLENEERCIALHRVKRWYICRLCEQHYHGAVSSALGWACYKTYFGRPEGDHLWELALQILCGSMQEDKIGRLAILEPIAGRLARETERHPHKLFQLLYVRSQVADCLAQLGRNDECLALRRLNYEAGPTDAWSLAIDLGESLITARHAEAVEFTRHYVDRAERELGEESPVYEQCLMSYARAISTATKRSPEMLTEAEAIVAATARSWRRRYGDSHPNTRIAEAGVGKIRAKILFNGVLAELLAARNCG